MFKYFLAPASVDIEAESLAMPLHLECCIAKSTPQFYGVRAPTFIGPEEPKFISLVQRFLVLGRNEDCEMRE